MKKFLYSLIVSIFLASMVWAAFPNETYANHCNSSGPRADHVDNDPSKPRPGGNCLSIEGIKDDISGAANTVVTVVKYTAYCTLNPFDCAAIAILGLTGYILYGAGVLLNFAVAVTILDMSNFVRN